MITSTTLANLQIRPLNDQQLLCKDQSLKIDMFTQVSDVTLKNKALKAKILTYV